MTTSLHSVRGGTLRRLLTRFGGLAVLDEAGGAFLPRGAGVPGLPV
ncbi:hypothetical protein [Streptomyces sp. NPDC059597]